MSLIAAAVILATLGAGWVVHPILRQRWGHLHDPLVAGSQDREIRKRVALAALKDAEYEHAAGKLDESDYREIRSRLELEALNALSAAEESRPPAVEQPETHSCGFLNPAGSRFCSGCGQRLG